MKITPSGGSILGGRQHTNLSRTARYAAPEAASGVLSFKADWWSLGIILLEAITGKTPFDNLSDAAITKHLITHPIEVSGVSDPRWANLLHGLLNRNDKLRWGDSEVARWLAGEDVPVATDTAAHVQVAQKPCNFAGKSYSTPAALGVGLAQNWDAAIKYLHRNYIQKWVSEELRDYDLASFIADLTESQDSPDVRLVKLLSRIAPELPPVWKGMDVSMQGLVKLANAARGDASQQTFLFEFINDGLPAFINPELIALAQRLTAAEESYRKAWAGMPDDARGAVSQPERPALLPSLLLVTEVSEVQESQREKVVLELDEDCRASGWFSAMSAPEEASGPELLLMAQCASLARHCGHILREQKREREERMSEREERMRQHGSILPDRVLENHTDTVTAVTFSPDGEMLATGSRDKSIRLWEATTCTMLRALDCQAEVRSIAFSPDGKRLASVGKDDAIRVWNVATGNQEYTLQMANEVTSIAFSPGGEQIAIGSRSTEVNIIYFSISENHFYFKDYSELLRGHERLITSVAYSPDWKMLASGSEDRTIRLWNAETRKLIVVLSEKHTSAVTSVVFSSDEKLMASGSKDGTICLWNVATKSYYRKLLGHSDSVRSMAFSPNGRFLASGSEDKTIRLWDATTGRELQVLNGHADQVLSVAFNPETGTLASGGKDKTVQLWEYLETKLLEMAKSLPPPGPTETPQPIMGDSQGPRPVLMTADAIKSEALSRISMRAFKAVVIGAVVIAFGTGGLLVYQERARLAEVQAQSIDKDAQMKRQLEHERKANVESKVAAEAQALAEARAQAELEAQALAEARARAELEAQALAEARARTEAEARVNQEKEMMQRRIEELADKFARQQQELLKRQQEDLQQRGAAPATGMNPGQDQQENHPAALDPRTRCAKKDNFISKALCETRACQKPEYSSHSYCEKLRQQSSYQTQ